ncbi:MAG: glycosyl transferase family 2 [Odoribacter sp.]|nr:glycosyl transferase family 2 [Odoribacter sp.]
MHKTAIVILNWNGIGYLKKFLETAVNNSISSGSVLFVADNGSTDGSADWVEKNFPSVKLIMLEENHGFAGGYNIALRQIDARYFILLNSDIEVTPGWTEPLISFMDNNPDAAACQPKILSWHNREFFEYAGAAGGYIDKFGYPFCRGRIFNSLEKDSGQYNSRKDIFWSSGACMIVRAEAWKKSSGFDADFFAHMEEIDLCWRFQKAGYRVCFTHESVVYHVGGGVLPYDSPFKTYLNFRNNLFLLYKNLPENKLHTTLFIRMLLDGIAALLFVFNGKFTNVRSVWQAHMDYYKAINSLKIKRKSVKSLTTAEFSTAVLNKSIVFEFYIKRNKTFDKLKMNI